MTNFNLDDPSAESLPGDVEFLLFAYEGIDPRYTYEWECQTCHERGIELDPNEHAGTHRTES